MLSAIDNKISLHVSTWLIISLVVLNMLDFQTTYIALSMGMLEANPILAYLMELTKTIWVIFWFKLVALSGIFLPYAFFEKYRERCQTKKMVWTLAALAVIYVGIVLNNLYIITV